MVTRYLTKNPCYKQGRVIEVKGLMLHSVGVAQPDPLVFIRQFDKASYDRACVHGFIGPDETYITLPILVNPGQAMRGWHGGKSASNNAYIGVEMTEPKAIRYISGATFQVLNLTEAVAHIKKVTARAVDLFAELCLFHGLNPKTDVISHKEGNLLGIASAHADPDHLWKGLNMDYNMDTFRQEVADRMEELDMDINKLINDMTDEQAYTLLQKAYAHADTLPEPVWSQVDGHWKRATEHGITDGTNPERPMKRCEVIAVMGRSKMF